MKFNWIYKRCSIPGKGNNTPFNLFRRQTSLSWAAAASIPQVGQRRSDTCCRDGQTALDTSGRDGQTVAGGGHWKKAGRGGGGQESFWQLGLDIFFVVLLEVGHGSVLLEVGHGSVHLEVGHGCVHLEVGRGCVHLEVGHGCVLFEVGHWCVLQDVGQGRLAGWGGEAGRALWSDLASSECFWNESLS